MLLTAFGVLLTPTECTYVSRQGFYICLVLSRTFKPCKWARVTGDWNDTRSRKTSGRSHESTLILISRKTWWPSTFHIWMIATASQLVICSHSWPPFTLQWKILILILIWSHFNLDLIWSDLISCYLFTNNSTRVVSICGNLLFASQIHPFLLPWRHVSVRDRVS